VVEITLTPSPARWLSDNDGTTQIHLDENLLQLVIIGCAGFGKGALFFVFSDDQSHYWPSPTSRSPQDKKCEEKVNNGGAVASVQT
jgi:hypothetical protein